MLPNLSFSSPRKNVRLRSADDDKAWLGYMGKVSVLITCQILDKKHHVKPSYLICKDNEEIYIISIAGSRENPIPL